MAGLSSRESQRVGEAVAASAGSLCPEVYGKSTIRQQSLVSRPALRQVSYLPASACPDQESGYGGRREDARGEVHTHLQKCPEAERLDLRIDGWPYRGRSSA